MGEGWSERAVTRTERLRRLLLRERRRSDYVRFTTLRGNCLHLLGSKGAEQQLQTQKI